MSVVERSKAAGIPAVAGAAALALCGGTAEATPVTLNQTIGVGGSFDLDIDHDGTAEYSFYQSAASFGGSAFFVDTHGNQVVGTDQTASPVKPGLYASALGAHTTIDDSLSYVGGSNVILAGLDVLDFPPIPSLGIVGGPTPFPFGNFAPPKDAFLGLKFTKSGGGADPFGWIEIQTVDPDHLTLLRADFSGDPITTPNLTAAVPEPAGLALLAVGASGVLAMRRRKRAR
jgi:hypothetical protein